MDPLKRLVLFLFLFPLFAWGQNLKGSVLNSQNKLAIQDVNIALKETNENTKTDDKGSFKLKVSKNLEQSDTLYVSHIGYTPKKISFFDLKKNNYLIFLDEKMENLNGLTLSSTKREFKSKLNFIKLAPLQYRISSFGSVIKDNKIYVIGGDGSFKTDA